jgi:hypothetical protein
MSSCQELINDFLKSTNQRFIIKYQHIGKINLDDATGYYKNSKCIMTDNDFDKLSENKTKYKQETFADTIYMRNGDEYVVPANTVLTSK